MSNFTTAIVGVDMKSVVLVKLDLLVPLVPSNLSMPELMIGAVVVVPVESISSNCVSLAVVYT